MQTTSTLSSPFVIYLSQLESFKKQSKELADKLTSAIPNLKLSAFKRNDYLSIALGYKGHSDLVKSAHFRASSDDNSTLSILSDEDVRYAIATVYSNKIPEASFGYIYRSCCPSEKNLESDIISHSTLSNYHTLLMALADDYLGSSMWKEGVSLLLNGVLAVLIDRRDNQGIKVNTGSLRECLPLEQVIKLFESLKISGCEEHPLFDYIDYLSRSAKFVTGDSKTYKRASEQHGYFCSYINEALSLEESFLGRKQNDIE